MQSTEVKSEKRSRFSSRRANLFAAAGLFTFAALASASPGYLPCIGPAPLRFRSIPAPVTNQFVLPAPEPTPEPEAVAPKPQIAEPPPPAPVAPVEPAAVTNQASSDPVEPPHPDDVVSPQMLLKYFNKGTNGSSSTIIAPLDFTPPKAAAPAQSRATYSTGP